jgi:hypothetical protein
MQRRMGEGRAIRDALGRRPWEGRLGHAGQEWGLRGTKVTPLHADLPVVMHPTQPCRPRRRMAINPLTNRVYTWQDIDFLEGVDNNGGNVSVPALRGVCPTRDLPRSTGLGIASGTNRVLSELKALKIDFIENSIYSGDAKL